MVSTILQHRRRLSNLDIKRMTGLYDENIRFLMQKNQYGVDCTFIFPPRKDPCPNCIPNTFGASSGLYKQGGPEPFTKPETCPICRGIGSFEKNNREHGIMIVVFDVKNGTFNWLKPGETSEMPDGTVLVIGERSKHWHQVTTCKNIILNTDVYGDGAPFILKNEPYSCGLFQAGDQGRSRWFMAYFTREGAS